MSTEKIRFEDITPAYEGMHDWEFYPSYITTEYQQCIDEGLDMEEYKELFEGISKLKKGKVKKKFGDLAYEVVMTAKKRDDYKYNEPSDLEGIRALRLPHGDYSPTEPSYTKVLGAWQGRVAGCMLGKTVEGVRSDKLIPMLKETDNYPMHKYIFKRDLEKIGIDKYVTNPWYADELDGMPIDDDTNYTVLSQILVGDCGRDFVPCNVSWEWGRLQHKGAYCTAERKAYCNFTAGYLPPYSAVYQNPFREWIGAQIRSDYYGYINPGNPSLAAEMAWRDASISHVKNGIYGSMTVAAMLAVAAVTDSMEEIVLAGLAEIPHTSRLYEDIMFVYDSYKKGTDKAEVFAAIHEKYDEYTEHGWCHTIPNAMIVAASLLYGEGDFARSICMAVEAAFDTDCNGATVGSIVGMAKGAESIPAEWTEPFGDKLNTSMVKEGSVSITEMAKKTMEHMPK